MPSSKQFKRPQLKMTLWNMSMSHKPVNTYWVDLDSFIFRF